MSTTMRKSALRVLALTILLAGPTQVSAADLGGGPPPEPYGYQPARKQGDWTGFYIGLTYGYATGWTDVSSSGFAFDIDTDGGNGSVFSGYDWQFGRLVTGIEADIGTGNLGGNENGVSSDINSIGSIRSRLGYLVTPNFLVYGTAGFAYADFDLSANGNTQSETFTGYQVGLGADLKFSGPWSLRLEYIYTDLGSETLNHSGVTNTYEPDFHTARAGLSYRF